MSLLDTIRGAIAPATVENLATDLGESPDSTRGALTGIVPVMLAAMARRVDAGDAGGVTNMIKSALAGGNALDNQKAATDRLGTDTALAQHGGAFGDLFGAGFGGIASTLGGHFGIRPGSAQALLGMAGLFTAGGIGKALGREPTPQGVTDLLRGEQSAINAALPARLAGMFGARTETASGSSRYREEAPPAPRGIAKWWPLLLIVLGVIALIWALRSCGREQPSATVAEPSATVAPMPTPAIPTGAGVLTNMLEGRPVLRVYFDVGKSDVTKDLSNAAKGISDYFGAHPGTTVVVAGYNDPTGNAEANAALSKRRAEEVSKALQATGIPAASIRLVKPANATGTGDTNAESRRVDVTVTE
jgi:outer membrane protein OmpA-like peptidoglycan-associated protein